MVVAVLALVDCGGDEGDPPGAGGGDGPAPATAHAMPSGPVGLVADGTGTVWAAIPASGALVQVSDPDAAPADVGDTPLRAAFSGDELWVSVFGAGVLAEVDAATGDVTRTLEVGAEPEGIADGFGSLWVLEPARKSATDRRVWPRSRTCCGSPAPGRAN